VGLFLDKVGIAFALGLAMLGQDGDENCFKIGHNGHLL